MRNARWWPTEVGRGLAGGGRTKSWRHLHREGNAFSGQVHLRHGDHNFLLDLDHFLRIFDETVADLADMNQSILVDANVHEGAEGRHVGGDARQFHTRFQVLHFLHARLEGKHLKLLARVGARLRQFAASRASGLLWTTHNMVEVQDVCDRVLFLSHGKIMLEGDPKRLPDEHGQPTLEDLFVAVAREPLTLGRT